MLVKIARELRKVRIAEGTVANEIMKRISGEFLPGESKAWGEYDKERAIRWMRNAGENGRGRAFAVRAIMDWVQHKKPPTTLRTLEQAKQFSEFLNSLMNAYIEARLPHFSKMKKYFSSHVIYHHMRWKGDLSEDEFVAEVQKEWIRQYGEKDYDKHLQNLWSMYQTVVSMGKNLNILKPGPMESRK